MKQLTILLLLFAMVSCGGPEPRKPVKVKSGSYFTESVERSKKLLAKEEAMIKTIIDNDTAIDYSSNPNGFWYHIEVKNDTATYLPKNDDEVIVTYNLMTLNNDTLYSSADIGRVRLMVDKVQLFPGMRSAIKHLKEGERGTFLFPSSLAFGYHGDGEKIAPMTPIKSTVTLLKINRKSEISNQN